MYCSKCGQQLPDDAMFCTSCGAATNSTSTPKEKKKGHSGIIIGLLSICVALLVIILVVVILRKPTEVISSNDSETSQAAGNRDKSENSANALEESEAKIVTETIFSDNTNESASAEGPNQHPSTEWASSTPEESSSSASGYSSRDVGKENHSSTSTEMSTEVTTIIQRMLNCLNNGDEYSTVADICDFGFYFPAFICQELQPLLDPSIEFDIALAREVLMATDQGANYVNDNYPWFPEVLYKEGLIPDNRFTDASLKEFWENFSIHEDDVVAEYDGSYTEYESSLGAVISNDLSISNAYDVTRKYGVTLEFDPTLISLQNGLYEYTDSYYYETETSLGGGTINIKVYNTGHGYKVIYFGGPSYGSSKPRSE